MVILAERLGDKADYIVALDCCFSRPLFAGDRVSRRVATPHARARASRSLGSHPKAHDQKSGVEQAGTIVDISADLFVDYSFGTFLLVDQVLVKGNNSAFARQGDSGAIVVDNSTDRAVALVFATAGKFTAVCPLQRALELLGVWPPNGNLSAT